MYWTNCGRRRKSLLTVERLFRKRLSIPPFSRSAACSTPGGEDSAARQIFDYVLRDMLDPEGGFYSAEDADSVIDPAKPKEKGEGAFYVWTQAEIERIVGKPSAAYFSYQFGVEANGNVREDPHQEFT